MINWHDHSWSRNDFWGRCYAQLLHELVHQPRPWFATASDAVSWFGWRRSFRFVEAEEGCITVEVTETRRAGSPAALLVYRPRSGALWSVEELCCDGSSVTVSL